MRLKIAKLAASPISPLKSKPKFRNELLQDQTWPEDVKWLRDTYNDIVLIWDELKEPEQDALLFKRTEPKLRELVLSLLDVVPQVPWMPMIKRYMQNARHDFEISAMYNRSGDFASAVLYQSYSLAKIHGVLENMTRAASMSSRYRFSSFAEKMAYGYDQAGEVIDTGSQEIANRENQTNINDTAQPQDHHETPANPANIRDVDADKEFPSLEEKKNKRVVWPARTR